jgi:hypothetical protein
MCSCRCLARTRASPSLHPGLSTRAWHSTGRCDLHTLASISPTADTHGLHLLLERAGSCLYQPASKQPEGLMTTRMGASSTFFLPMPCFVVYAGHSLWECCMTC